MLSTVALVAALSLPAASGTCGRPWGGDLPPLVTRLLCVGGNVDAAGTG